MAPSNRRIQFNLENINEYDNQCDKNSAKQVKIPAFQKSRFELSSNNNKQNEPSSIKEQFRPDLKQLSLTELKNLLIKQEKIVRNRKLLENLKDKGEKAKKFLNEIQQEILIREQNISKNIVKTEQLLEELSIKEEIKEEINDDNEIKMIEQPKISQYKDAYSQNRARLLDQNHSNKRFNQPAAKTTTAVIEPQRSVRTLSYLESLEHLEKATRKEKHSLHEQMIRFYDYRTRDDDDDDDGEYDDESVDSDNDDDDPDRNYIRVNFQ
ncbi:uncharacterized protein LOC113791212 [Dermatophagoides pteronyssinus]|uniref:uncharacterized protein LOC113791212 n=1 Tax=Dermatophagoides pteronyssinus TaxID=6956 RepID=UPI003F677B6D